MIHLRRYRGGDTAAVTKHALRTITSHTVRWTINVTTGSSRSKTYGRKRSFVRIRMIVVRVRARVPAYVCVRACVCVCECVCARVSARRRRVATITVKRSGGGPLGFRRMTPTGYERGCRSTGRCSASERARIQTNLGGGPNVPKRPIPLQPLKQPRRRRSRERSQPRRVVGRSVQVRLRFIMRKARFPPRKSAKTSVPESKTFRKRIRWVWVSKTVLRGGGGRTAVVTPVRRASERVDVRATPRRQPTAAAAAPKRRKKALSPTTTPPRAELCFKRGDDDPLSIPFSLFRISARDACYIHVIVSATKKILAPQSLHNDYY